MDKIQRFCDELTTCYAEHHLSPSLILSSVPDRKNKGQRIGYAAVHTFPNGLASRNIVCKGSGPSVEAALDQCIEIWVGMQALLTNTPPATEMGVVQLDLKIRTSERDRLAERLAEAEELLRQAMLRRTCYCESASCHCGAYRHSADFGKAAAAFLARTEPAK